MTDVLFVAVGCALLVGVAVGVALARWADVDAYARGRDDRTEEQLAHGRDLLAHGGAMLRHGRSLLSRSRVDAPALTADIERAILLVDRTVVMTGSRDAN